MKHGAVRLTYLPKAAAETPMESTPQVAYALGKRFGTAVERNRARRRLRDAFAASWQHHLDSVAPTLRLDGAFLLSGHGDLLTAPFPRLVDDMSTCLARLVDTVGTVDTVDRAGSSPDRVSEGP